MEQATDGAETAAIDLFRRDWRDALETVNNSRKLSDALGNPSTQRKCYCNKIWQVIQTRTMLRTFEK